MSRAIFDIFKVFATFAVVAAMGLSGFAHTVPRTDVSPELAAYLAAGGSVADLCHDIGEDHSDRHAPCDACRLIAAALIPRPCEGPAITLSLRTRVQARVSESLRQARSLDPVRMTRAPPQV